MSMEKPQYPTDLMGVPVIPNDTSCYKECPKDIREKNTHHLAWPRHEYNTNLERKYRNAACMSIKICMCLHEDIHASYLPPEEPSRAVMSLVELGQLAPQRAEDVEVVLQIRTKAQLNEENCHD